MSRKAHSLAIFTLLAAVAANAALAAEPPRERQRELLHLLRHDCGSCHGLTLKGGLGRPLLPQALAGRDAETLAGIILDGIPGTPMPPWRGILSRQDARWLARRLKEGIGDAAP